MGPHTIEQIRNRMMRAWDGIEYLSAKATIKYFGSLHPSAQRPGFLQPADADRPPYTLQAWWASPDRWRYDQNRFNWANTSYVGVGEQWSLWKDGLLDCAGTIAEAQRQRFTHNEALFYGRPYLTPESNAHLWLWLNPAIWVASFALAANNWYAPLRDDVFYDEHVVHVMAGEGLKPGVETPAQREHYQKWWVSEWDRDEELTDYGNFFQLWVDMRTGFCRRMTSEGSNGRQWDIIVESLSLNERTQVPDSVFHSPTPH